jgi:hypothetical protein
MLEKAGREGAINTDPTLPTTQGNCAMDDPTMDERLAALNLSSRAMRGIRSAGGIGAVAENIKHREIKHRLDGSTYTWGGWRQGTRFRNLAVGPKGGAEMTAAALRLGLIGWDDCGFRSEELFERRRLNNALSAVGWDGPFLDDRRDIRIKAEQTAAKIEKLESRRAKLKSDIERIDAKLAQLRALRPG